MVDYTTHVRLVEGRAEIETKNRSLQASRRDEPNDPYNCPVELLIGALGS